jgi:hypothetical protein
MPKLPPAESLITIFRSEDKIVPIINGLLLIIDSQVQQQERWLVSLSPRKIESLSLEDINKLSTLMIYDDNRHQLQGKIKIYGMESSGDNRPLLTSVVAAIDSATRIAEVMAPSCKPSPR